MEVIWEDQDANSFLVSVYVHSNRDEYLMVELDEDGRTVFDNEVHMALHYLGYESELVYRITLDGKSELLAVAADGKWFGEDLEDHQKRAARHNGSR